MKIRVLSLPGRNYRGNDYFKLFCDSLEAAGIDIINVHEPQAKRFEFDLLHIHFPEHFVTERTLFQAMFASLFFAAFLLTSKALGKTIVWTVHDVTPFKIRHEWMLWRYLAVVRWCVDGFVFMNNSSHRQFINRYPNQGKKPSCWIHHGPYPVTHLSEADCRRIRTEVAGADEGFLLASLGDIKPYKNIEVLKNAPRQTAAGSPVKILIAGKPDPSKYACQLEELWTNVGRDRMIRINERLTNSRLEELIQIADVVLLPYREGSNSGFAMLALSCHARILCSPLPMFTDLAESVGKPWVNIVDFEKTETSLADIIEEIIKRPVLPGDKVRLEAFLQAAAFEKGGQKLASFYSQIRSKNTHAHPGHIAASGFSSPEAKPEQIRAANAK